MKKVFFPDLNVTIGFDDKLEGDALKEAVKRAHDTLAIKQGKQRQTPKLTKWKGLEIVRELPPVEEPNMSIDLSEQGQNRDYQALKLLEEKIKQEKTEQPSSPTVLGRLYQNTMGAVQQVSEEAKDLAKAYEQKVNEAREKGGLGGWAANWNDILLQTAVGSGKDVIDTLGEIVKGAISATGLGAVTGVAEKLTNIPNKKGKFSWKDVPEAIGEGIIENLPFYLKYIPKLEEFVKSVDPQALEQTGGSFLPIVQNIAEALVPENADEATKKGARMIVAPFGILSDIYVYGKIKTPLIADTKVGKAVNEILKANEDASIETKVKLALDSWKKAKQAEALTAEDIANIGGGSQNLATGIALGTKTTGLKALDNLLWRFTNIDKITANTIAETLYGKGNPENFYKYFGKPVESIHDIQGKTLFTLDDSGFVKRITLQELTEKIAKIENTSMEEAKKLANRIFTKTTAEAKAEAGKVLQEGTQEVKDNQLINKIIQDLNKEGVKVIEPQIFEQYQSAYKNITGDFIEQYNKAVASLPPAKRTAFDYYLMYKIEHPELPLPTKEKLVQMTAEEEQNINNLARTFREATDKLIDIERKYTDIKYWEGYFPKQQKVNIKEGVSGDVFAKSRTSKELLSDQIARDYEEALKLKPSLTFEDFIKSYKFETEPETMLQFRASQSTALAKEAEKNIAGTIYREKVTRNTINRIIKGEDITLVDKAGKRIPAEVIRNKYDKLYSKNIKTLSEAKAKERAMKELTEEYKVETAVKPEVKPAEVATPAEATITPETSAASPTKPLVNTKKMSQAQLERIINGLDEGKYIDNEGNILTAQDIRDKYKKLVSDYVEQHKGSIDVLKTAKEKADGQINQLISKTYQVDPEAERILDTAQKLLDNWGTVAHYGSLSKFFFTPWKSIALFGKPGTEVRNFIGNKFLRWYNGYPVMTKEDLIAIRYVFPNVKLSGEGKAYLNIPQEMLSDVVKIGNKKMSLSHIIEMAKKYNVYEDATAKVGFLEAGGFGLQNPLGYYGTFNKMNWTRIEVADRLGLFMHLIGRGEAPVRAGAMVNFTLYDYSRLPIWARRFQEWGIPFVGWYYNNVLKGIPRMLTQNIFRVAGVAKAKEDWERIATEEFPYHKGEREIEQGATAVWKQKNGLINYMVWYNLDPIMQVNLVQPSIKETGFNVFALMNPYFNQFVEQLFNFSAYRNKPIEVFRGQKGNFFGLDIPVVSSYAVRALLPILGDIDRLNPFDIFGSAEQGKRGWLGKGAKRIKEEPPFLARLIRFMAGINTQEKDVNQAIQHEQTAMTNERDVNKNYFRFFLRGKDVKDEKTNSTVHIIDYPNIIATAQNVLQNNAGNYILAEKRLITLLATPDITPIEMADALFGNVDNSRIKVNEKNALIPSLKQCYDDATEILGMLSRKDIYAGLEQEVGKNKAQMIIDFIRNYRQQAYNLWKTTIDQLDLLYMQDNKMPIYSLTRTASNRTIYLSKELLNNRKQLRAIKNEMYGLGLGRQSLKVMPEGRYIERK